MAADPHSGLKQWGAGQRSFHVRPVENGFMTAYHDGADKVHEAHAPSQEAVALMMRRAFAQPVPAPTDGAPNSSPTKHILAPAPMAATMKIP
jgi:hypothetical protein